MPEVALIYSYMEFQDLIKKHAGSLDYYASEEDLIKKQLGDIQEAIGIPRNHVRSTSRYKNIRGEEFIVHISKTKIYIWDHTGSDSLGFFGFDELHKLDEATRLYSQGNIKCADCDQPTDRFKAGRFYAGRYCPDCWLGNTGRFRNQGGWKQREAREKYD